MRFSFFYMGVCCLLIICCSCQKRVRKIIFTPPCMATTPPEQSSPQSSCNTVDKYADLPNDFHDSDNDDLAYVASLQEAKLPDVPIPQSACPLLPYFKSCQSSNDVVLGYQCKSERSAIVSFYESQMAGLGWQCLAEVDGIESIRLFQKPDRLCVVCMRNCNNKCQQLIIAVTYKNKNQSSN